MSLEKQSKQETVIEILINKALAKIGAKRENDLCHYLPVGSGSSSGYMHHFTLRKLKHQDPEQLSGLITSYVINVDKPVKVPPKSRAPRGSRKQKDKLAFTEKDLDKLRQFVRLAGGDKEMLRKLTPRKDFRTIKRELISSIRHGRVEVELWESYVEAMETQNLTTANVAALT